MGQQRAIHITRALGPQGGQAQDDARGAEAALAGTGGAEGIGPRLSLGVRQAVDGGDRPAGHPPGRRDAGDPRRAVDQHRAAPALALGTAPILRRARAEAVAKYLEKRGVLVLDGDLLAVEGELEGQLAEALPAAAGAGRVRVVDGEPGALEAVLEVKRRALEERRTRRIYDDPDTAGVVGDVVSGHVGVEEHLVAESRAPAGTDGDAQGEVLLALGRDQLLDLGDGLGGEGDHCTGVDGLLLDTHVLSLPTYSTDSFISTAERPGTARGQRAFQTVQHLRRRVLP